MRLCLILILCIGMMPILSAQNDDSGDWIIAEGNGQTRKGAILHAKTAAIMKYLKLNMDKRDFASFEQELESFVKANAQEYCNEEVSVEKEYRDGTIRVMVGIRGEELIQAVNDQFLSAQKKAGGLEFALVLDPKKKHKKKDCDVMLDVIAQTLSKHFKLIDPKAAAEMIKTEAKAFDQAASGNPQSHAWKKHSVIQIFMYFSMQVSNLEDEDEDGYRVTIHAKGVHRLTGQKVFQFKKDKSGSNRGNTIVKAAQDVAQEILKTISFYNTVLPEHTYVVKFKNFSPSEKDKIDQAMLGLDKGKKGYMTILPGGRGSSAQDFEYKVKWLRKHSQFEIQAIIQEHCELNGVDLRCDYFAEGVMVYTPGSYTGSTGGSDEIVEEKPKKPKRVEEEEEEEEEEEDCIWVQGEGSGMTENGAKIKAVQHALTTFIKNNVDRRDFEGNQQKIQNYVLEKAPQYMDRIRIKKKFSPERGTIIVRVCIEEAVVVNDMNFILKEAQKTAAGLRVVIGSAKLPDAEKDVNYRAEDEAVDRGIMFDVVQNIISKAGVEVYDKAQLDEILKTEAMAFGQSASSDPEAFILKKFNNYDVYLSLWVVTKKWKDEAMGPAWGATIGCKMLRIQTAQEYMRFQESSIRRADGDRTQNYTAKPVFVEMVGDRTARQDAIKNVAEVIGKQIVKNLMSMPLPQPNEFVLRFKNFSPLQSDKVKTAMLKLSRGKKAVCNIEDGGRGSGAGDLEYRVKWNRDKLSEEEVKAWVREACEQEGLNIRDDVYTKGVQWFTPGSEE